MPLLVSTASFASRLETGKSNRAINWQVRSGYSADSFYREEKAVLLSVWKCLIVFGGIAILII